MRITLVVFVLIGGTISFGFWSLQQFDDVFVNLSASSYTTISPRVRELSTIATTTTIDAASTTSQTSSTTTSDHDEKDMELQLTFSPKGDGVYIGCTYEISWTASTTIQSLETALIDAGTMEASGPIASGLARRYDIQADSQSLDWKVGVVWPGEYFISISKINGFEKETKSIYFMIREMPEGKSASERENICTESGGTF